LQHAGDDTASGFGTVFQGRGGGVSVKTSHGDAEEGANSEELAVGLGEASAEFEDDEQDVVDDERPGIAWSAHIPRVGRR
jgi:hypothetical protein